MNYQLDVTALASLVSTKRAGRALPDVAAEIGGLSSSWLSRIEHRQAPSLTTLLHLCNWLKIPPAQFLYDADYLVPTSTNEEMFPHLEVVNPEPETLEAVYYRHMADANAELEKLFWTT